jgi:hypothetical protein
MMIGIDGAFVKGCPPTDRANLEIITEGIEADAEPSKAFAVVRETKMAMPNSTFRRCYGKGDETLRPSCVLSPMVRTA